MALTPLVDRPLSEELSWALFGFSPAAALVFVTSCPRSVADATTCATTAARGAGRGIRGPCSEYSLSPSPARSALLCWSMHHMPSAGGEPYIFGPYFLVPFGLAVAAILLEIGLVERQQGVAVSALLVPPILVFLTLVGHRADPTYQWFLERFVSRLGGTPFYLTMLISAGFYAYAALLRCRRHSTP